MHNSTTQFVNHLKALTTFLFLIITMGIQAQCPSGYVQLSTQAEVNAFVADYPNCMDLNGGLQIGSSSGTSDIYDISGLENIQTLNGDLVISNCPSLNSLTGLESLNTMRFYLEIYNCDGLTDLLGLSSLTNTNNFQIYIAENENLLNFKGLENITNVNSSTFEANSSLIDFTGFEGIEEMSDVYIGENASLENLNGLQNVTNIRGGISMYGNNAMTSLEGLNSLTKIGFNSSLRYFDLGSAASLTDISALSSLTLVGDVYLYDLPSLTNITGLENIDLTLLGDFSVNSCPALDFCNISSVCSFVNDPNSNVNSSFSNNGAWCSSEADIITSCDPCIYIGSPGQLDDDSDGIENGCDPAFNIDLATETTIVYIEDLNLNNGNQNALIGKIEDALDKYCNGKTNQALNKLNAFINQVAALENSGKITSAEASDLITAAQNTIDAINDGTVECPTNNMTINPNNGLNTNVETMVDLQIFPNPASSKVTVQWEANGENTTLSITDLLGRIVWQQSITEGMNRMEIDLNNGHFIQGIYHVTMENNGGRTTQRLIVQ